MDKVRHVSDEYFASEKIDDKVLKLILDLWVPLVYRSLSTKTDNSVNPYNLIVATVKNSSKIPNIFLYYPKR